jgi:hypothetical protein
MTVFFEVDLEKCYISIIRGAMMPVLSDISPDQSFSPIDFLKNWGHFYNAWCLKICFQKILV